MALPNRRTTDVKIFMQPVASVLVAAHAVATGSDGSLVTSIAGQTTVPISDILKHVALGQPMVVGIDYSIYHEAAMSICFSDAQVKVRFPHTSEWVSATSAVELLPRANDAANATRAVQALNAYYSQHMDLRRTVIPTLKC